MAIGSGILLAACGDDEAAQSTAPPLESAARGPSQAGAAPSAVSERIFGERGLIEIQEIAAQLELDWAVLAAALRLERGRLDAQFDERDRNHTLAIAYALQALGATADARTALTARRDDVYARRVLALAARLKRSPLQTPLAELPLRAPHPGPVIAGYGLRLGVLHDGIDIDARAGTPVRSAGDGIVVSATEHPLFGLMSCVAHRVARAARDRPITTCYGNQSGFRVAPGDRVTAGQAIGSVGCTGTCLRPHVHFQVRLGADQNAPTTDPAPFLAPSLAAEARAGGRPLEPRP